MHNSDSSLPSEAIVRLGLLIFRLHDRANIEQI